MRVGACKLVVCVRKLYQGRLLLLQAAPRAAGL